VTDKPIAQLAINTIRTLSIDAIQQANSGHPCIPMAMAPVVYCLWQRFLRFDLLEGWDNELPLFAPDSKGLASRDSSGQVLNSIEKKVPWLLGGSADLSPSTKTRLTFDGARDFQAGSYGGRNLHFGIREHAMAAVLNGIFSHDSIGVGEDGPTHQPIEQLANLRSLPGLLVIRPCDANEVVEAWKVIMKHRHTPVALILTRQALPTLDRRKYGAAGGLARGAYVLADAPNGKRDVLLLARGSEVALCVQAYEQLLREGISARVISMPCWRLFEAEDQTYRDSVLPPTVKARISIEEGSTFGWERYTGENGESLGMHFFGASAPLKALQSKFGFTVEHVVQAAKTQIATQI
jgi:transketolase